MKKVTYIGGTAVRRDEQVQCSRGRKGMMDGYNNRGRATIRLNRVGGVIT